MFENAAEKQNDFHRLMLQASPDIFLYLNKNKKIRFVNNAYVELIDCDREKILGQDMTSIIPNDFIHVFNHRLELCETEGASEMDMEIVDTNDDKLPVWCRMRALFNREGEIEGYVIVFRDMYERKMIEENLINKYNSLKSKIGEKEKHIRKLKKDLHKETIARERYRNAINALQSRMNLEYDIVKLSRDFFNESNGGSEESMMNIFEVIGKTINAENGFIYKAIHEENVFKLSNRWQKRGCENMFKLPKAISMQQSSWLFEHLNGKNNLYVYSRSELDERYERELLKIFHDFHSLIIISLKYKDKLVGFFGFLSTEMGFNFMFDDFVLLELVGNLFVFSDIFELGTGDNIAASFTVQRILDVSNDYSLVVDQNGRILYTDPLLRKRLGYNYSEIVGQKLVSFCKENFDFAGEIFEKVGRKSKIKIMLRHKSEDNIEFIMNVSFGKFKGSHAIFLMGNEIENLDRIKGSKKAKNRFVTATRIKRVKEMKSKRPSI